MIEIFAKINNKLSIVIKSEKENHSLQQKLIAVNWFDTRIEWLYHLYNILASRSVIKIGGQPLFKAKVSEDIVSGEMKRNILLLVKYPNGNAFKNLLESKYFQLVSLLRIKAVERFTFSFTKALINTNFEQTNIEYAIHHFKGKVDLEKLLEAISRKLGKNIVIEYASYSFAYLNRKQNESSLEQVPSIIDNILIYSSDEKGRLKEWLSTDTYKNMFNSDFNNYVGILNRIF